MMRQRALYAAYIGAIALIAGQVAGKATRDAYFLSHFSVEVLPLVIVVSSLLSIAVGFATARLMRTIAPARLLAPAFLLNAVFLLMEWAVAGVQPRLAALLIYLQVAVVNSLLISGFWSLLADGFDPRSARKRFGKIVAAGTFGGVLGGIVVERVGAVVGVADMLPVLAAFQLVCAGMAAILSRASKGVTEESAQAHRGSAKSGVSGLEVLRTAAYVRNLAFLVVLSAMGAALLDYAFKARVATVGEEHDLVRLFALFYAGTGLLTFLIQLLLSRAAVERLGIAGTVSSLPLTVVFGSLTSLLLPGIAFAAIGRGSESIARNSLFKSGYEMLYAAIPRRERRATKSFIDVGVERVGDLLGAAVLGGILFVMPIRAIPAALIGSAAIGLFAFCISLRLRRGYVEALENTLVSQSPVTQSLPLAGIGQSILLTLRTFVTVRPAHQDPPPPAIAPAASRVVRDPLLQRIEQLQSTDPEVVKSLLKQPLEVVLAGHVIPLLAWDAVSTEAVEALKSMGEKITGQLVDTLLNPTEEFTIRRRIPRVLVAHDTDRAVDGLLAGLADSRFEVRFHSAQALEQIQRRNGDRGLTREVILAAVQRELDVQVELRSHYRIIDVAGKADGDALAVEHIFRLLELVLHREPLQAAHRALKSGGRLKETSLEYLENVLPPQLWQRILLLVEGPQNTSLPVSLEHARG